MRVVILGSGAVGCLFAALLEEAGHDVSLVARESASSAAREARLRQRGLILRRHGSDAVVLSAERVAGLFRPASSALAACEVAVVTVKRAGNAWVAELLKTHQPACVVACAQNGTGQADEVLGLAAPWDGVVLDGMLSVSVNYRDAGGAATPEVVTYSPRAAERLALDGAKGPSGEAVSAAFRDADFGGEAVPDIAAAQRTKMILNQNNAVAALFGFPVKRAIATATSRHLIAACMLEAKAVFERQGFALDDKLLGPLKLLSLPDWIFDCAFTFMQGLLPADEFESSMNQDLVAADGRATEVAYLNGVVVDAGKAAGVPTPMTEKVLAIVRDMEQGRRPRRLLTVDEAEALFFS